MRRTVHTLLVPTLLCVLPFIGDVFAEVPYTPSSLLYSLQYNGSFAYFLQPTDTDQPRTEFLSLNVSEEIDAANPPYTLLLDQAPFNSGPGASAYIPVIDQNGSVKVYVGSCRDSGIQPALWQFNPNPSSSTGNGTWVRFLVNETEEQTGSAAYGPNYLSAGFAYSPTNTTESSFFAFAGMCPFQDDTGTSWVAAANYSQTMIVLDPSPSTQATRYLMSTTGDRAPPIPEAGFTITPLQATYASSGDEVRQQQDFLLIGGHTQRAFINMSELAIFSGPQNSWSLITVDSVADTQKADLVLRDTPLIEPRSGHTAVLSPDGSKVIVFGGWVGNTSVPATPQLAILTISRGFMGNGKWSWRVPSMTDSGISEGTGIYGHGATMLPGGVMMIAGGYQISQSSKRSATGAQRNSQIYLYNVTSESWASSYESPYSVSPRQANDDISSSSSSRKTGLGVGIGLGLPAAAAVAVFTFFFCRRRKLRRSRDHEIHKLALGAQRAHYWGRDERVMASSIRNPPMREMEVNSDYPWSNNASHRSVGRKSIWQDHRDAAAERNRLLGDAHSPRKLGRPAINGRVYRTPPQFHEYNRGGATGGIHPIDEREEDEANGAEKTDAHESADLFQEPAFLTPRQTLVEGVGLPGGRDGRSAPDKAERTSSSLSDSSTSAKSVKSDHVSRAVPNSSSGRQSPDKRVAISGHSREGARSQDSTSTAISFEKRYSSDSYSTAHTTLSQRQAEAEYLLQEHPERSPVIDFFAKPAAPTRPRASEWIGNVRRVLSVSRNRAPATQTSNTTPRPSDTPKRNSTALGIAAAETRVPRRSVSASAELFRRKQGARDWGVDIRASREPGFIAARSTRDDFGLDGTVDQDSDGDWDVERAAEGRRVQVTFTVPKEKLRVVNATDGDLDDLSERSISRRNSSS